MDSGTCTPCVEDTYKEGLNTDTSCTPCQINSGTNGATGSTGQASCLRKFYFSSIPFARPSLYIYMYWHNMNIANHFNFNPLFLSSFLAVVERLSEIWHPVVASCRGADSMWCWCWRGYSPSNDGGGGGGGLPRGTL